MLLMTSPFFTKALLNKTLIAAFASVSLLTINSASAQPPTSLTVHKDPNCGCCTRWIEKVSPQFNVLAKNTAKLASLKDELNIGLQYRSCHTAISEQGYIFEGHVPVAAMNTFLASKSSTALGLSVPGMPIGSLGMEVGDNKMRYPIYQLNKDGTQTIFAYALGSEVLSYQ